jgi:hypothetical protein
MALIDAPIPGGSGYANAALLAKTAYQKALVRNNQKTLGAVRTFGYDADVNQNTGMLTNMRVNANNPAGVYQNMLRGHAQEDQAVRENAVGRGVFGGLAEQGRSNSRWGFAQDRAQLGSAVTGVFDQYGQEMQDAGFQRDQALYQAEWQATQDARKNELFNTADFSGAQYPDYGSPDAPGPDPNVPERPIPFGISQAEKYANINPAMKPAKPRAGTYQPYVPGGTSKNITQAVVNKAIKAVQAQTKKKK